MKKSFLHFTLLIPTISFAQSYSGDWSKVATGGGTRIRSSIKERFAFSRLGGGVVKANNLIRFKVGK